ncbi:MAG: nucleotidyltransferase domain-containing protein [Candidatus Kariarchaeaceae archaeon]|jgi:predicted nucleotidyltransferase
MSEIASHLPKELTRILNEIIKQYQSESAVDSIILTGSYARGDFTSYSDVDITIFFDKIGSDENPLYDLNYIDNHLFSISKSTVKEWEEKLSKPQELFSIYYAIKDSIVLYDRNNAFSNLKLKLSRDPWGNLTRERLNAINHETKGYVEEVYKLMKGIQENDKPLISFALTGLIIGITSIVAMQQKLLLRSENNLYENLQSSMGFTSKWSKLFIRCLGIDDNMPNTIIERGNSGLRLYLETLQNITMDAELKLFIQTPILLISEILEA